MANYLSATAINRAMKEVKQQLDIRTPTDLHMVQAAHSDIIIPYGEQGAGTVLTYGQAKARVESFQQKYGQGSYNYTKAQYNRQLRSLNRVIGARSTVEGARSSYIDNARELINNYNAWSGGEINIDNLDFQALKRVLDKATEQMPKREKGDSPKLFRYMHQYFEEEGLRTHGTIPEDYDE